MSPQLYWRVNSEQSYTKLLSWWRQQSASSRYKRPVWPGIATDRVASTTDPGRPASEIVNQVSLSRTIGKNWAGHCHWSMKSLLQNRAGTTSALQKSAYASPALVPPMPWMQATPPASPAISARVSGNAVKLSWQSVPGASKYAVQTRYGNQWYASAVTYANGANLTSTPNAIAVYAVDRYGNSSRPTVVTLR